MTEPVQATSSPSRWRRFSDALGRWARPLTIANLIAQGGIIVTGGAVRLTGSGLGCSTWPQCEPGSFTPEFHAETPLHAFIEFGNRTLTGVLLIIAALVAVAVINRRPDLKWWALAPFLGVVAQAVIGGITVLADLHPLIVAPHLWVSVLLVWAAVQLCLKFRDAPRRVGRCIKRELWVLNALTVAVVFLGTLTTGAGPHSGDADVTERLSLDPAAIARIHALSVWVFIVVLAVIVWKVRNDHSEGERDEVRRAWAVLVIVTLAQGAIGYVQYFTGLPEIIVGAHLAGAAVLVAAESAVFYLLRRRRPVAA